MAESNARSNAALDLDRARLDSLSQLNAYSERGLAIRTKAMEQDRIDNTYAQALTQATKERSKAQEDLNARIDNDVKLAGTRKTEEKRIEEIYQNKITLAGTANNLAKDTLKISTDTKLNQAEQNELVEEQNFTLGRLDVLKARELITNDEYIARKRVLELSNIQQRSDRERNITLEAYNKELEGLKVKLTEVMEFNQPTEGTEDAIKALLAERDARLASMQRIKDAKVEQAEWDAKQNERQVGYTAVFKSSFESMGDAIMEFAKTGKLNFKSLITDMIAGLVKLELKMAMTRVGQNAKMVITQQQINDLLDGADDSAKALNRWAAANTDKWNAESKPCFFHNFKIYQLEETRDIIDFGTARTYAGNKIIIDYDWHQD